MKYPAALFGLLGVGLWLAVAWGLARWRARRLAQLIAPVQWSVLMSGATGRGGYGRIVLRAFALAALVVALARPQWGVRWEEVRRRGLDIMIVLDVSRSMLAEDLKPNRLQQAKWGVRDLLRELKGDRVGLVAFAGSSFLQCPLTLDYAAFRMMLDDVYVGLIPRGGTAIAQALRKAMDSFDPKSPADRAIVLITDGEDHEGDPLALIPELRERNIRVFAVGVGTPEGDLIPVEERDGRRGFLKDRRGLVVKSALNETLLMKLAAATGGMYVRASPDGFGLDRIYAEGLANLQRAEQEAKMRETREERFYVPLVVALALLGIESSVPVRRRQP